MTFDPLERHHRTGLLLRALAELPEAEAIKLLSELTFRLHVDVDASRAPGSQAAAMTAANILARLGGTVVVEAPHAPLILAGTPWSHLSLSEACEAVVTWAGAKVGQGKFDAGIAIGGNPAPQSVAVSGDDWIAAVDVNFDPGHSATPLGSIAASCFGVARAFHMALASHLDLAPAPRKSLIFSLLQESVINDSSSRVKFSRASTIPSQLGLVGAGAVGQAVVWALSLSGSTGSEPIDIVDPQALDGSNLNRHLVSGVADVGLPKAVIASSFLSRSNGSRPFVLDFSAYQHNVGTPDILLSTVDNNDARYQIQGSFPRQIVHGATERERLSIAVLDAVNTPCLGCLFPRRDRSPAEDIAHQTGIPFADIVSALDNDGVVTADMVVHLAEQMSVKPSELHHLIGRNFREAYATEICGRLGAPLSDSIPAPTASYVSALAGTLVVAELLKVGNAELMPYSLDNYLQMAILYPEAAWRVSRTRDQDCPLMCSSEALQQYLGQRSFN